MSVLKNLSSVFISNLVKTLEDKIYFAQPTKSLPYNIYFPPIECKNSHLPLLRFKSVFYYEMSKSGKSIRDAKMFLYFDGQTFTERITEMKEYNILALKYTKWAYRENECLRLHIMIVDEEPSVAWSDIITHLMKYGDIHVQSMLVRMSPEELRDYESFLRQLGEDEPSVASPDIVTQLMKDGDIHVQKMLKSMSPEELRDYESFLRQCGEDEPSMASSDIITHLMKYGDIHVQSMLVRMSPEELRDYESFLRWCWEDQVTTEELRDYESYLRQRGEDRVTRKPEAWNFCTLL